MTLAQPPRSVRNNNPGNIEANSIPWVGLSSPREMTAEQRGEQRFCVFREPKYGFRALARILTEYQTRHALRTVAEIIGRFAPSNENDTAAYVRSVCAAIGTEADSPVDLSNLKTMQEVCRAISVHESGGWFFNSADLEQGVALALGRTTGPLIS